MYKIEKGKPLYFSLTVLRFFNHIPDKLDKSYLTRFWLKLLSEQFICFFVMCIEPLLHLIMSIKNKTGLDISEDFSMITGCSCCIIGTCLFAAQYHKWTEFFKEVTMHKYGNISNFEKCIQKFNFLSRVYFISSMVGTISYGLISVMHTSACEQLNEEKGLHEICGTFMHVWIPVDSINLPARIIIFFIQFISTVGGVTITTVIPMVILETTEVLILHIHLLNEQFIHLFEGNGEISDKLRLCIKNHIHILNLGKRLNKIIKYSWGHVTPIAALIFGVILNQMRANPVASGIFLSGYCVAVFIVCHTGQRIEDETLTTANAVYASNWHKADARTMKDLAFVLSRCQKPIRFDSLPLGILDYPLFLMIVKTSYSYLTLISQTI